MKIFLPIIALLFLAQNIVFGQNLPDSIIAIDTCFTIGYNPVCAKSGKYYLNSCYAKKAGESKFKERAWSAKDFSANDYQTWEIIKFCEPMAGRVNLILDLEDGTKIYQRAGQEEVFRGYNTRNCKCLSKGTLIWTPEGNIPVENLKKGDWVYTKVAGQIIAKPLLKVSRVLAGEGHKLVKITFDNDTVLMISALHPLENYKENIGNLKALQYYDGLKVERIENIDYQYQYTYDILPEGGSGTYFTHNIQMGSTLYREAEHQPSKLTKQELLLLLDKQQWQQAVNPEFYKKYPNKIEILKSEHSEMQGILFNSDEVDRFVLPTFIPKHIDKECFKFDKYRLFIYTLPHV